jgi:tRNA pseudouridine38-40 synthase
VPSSARPAGPKAPAVYKLTLAYDGTDFQGWQRQPSVRTIQGELEKAVGRLAGGRVVVHGAGRTDAGVHAAAQVASFTAALRLDDETLQRALNALLPRSVRVLSVERAHASFHARKSARSKVYQYRIALGRLVSPFDLRFVHHHPYPLNIARMRRAARLFVREADFSAFSSNRERNPVRRVVRSELRKRGQELVYAIEAAGFLRYMVRTIVGTLIEVGRGRLRVEDVERLFGEPRRTLASPTAPAKGLCLIRVDYGPNIKSKARASSRGLV